MKSLLFAVILALCCAGLLAWASDLPTTSTPVIRLVAPDVTKAGAEVVATGENLGAKSVQELYLTQGEWTGKVQITKQSATSISFQIPANTKAGKFGLMVLTAGIAQQLIDEPVFLTVE